MQEPSPLELAAELLAIHYKRGSLDPRLTRKLADLGLVRFDGPYVRLQGPEAFRVLERLEMTFLDSTVPERDTLTL